MSSGSSRGLPSPRSGRGAGGEGGCVDELEHRISINIAHDGMQVSAADYGSSLTIQSPPSPDPFPHKGGRGV